jgi:hypothetical protein
MKSHKDLSTAELKELKGTLATFKDTNPNAVKMIKEIEKELKRRQK